MDAAAARHSRTKHCVYCRRPEAEVGELSVRGNCRECGAKALVENVIQLQAKAGPRYEHFAKRRACRAAEELRRLGQTVAV